MKFQNPQQEKTHSQVGQILSELFDEPFHDEEDGHFYVRFGSTILEISVEPYGQDETVVMIMAYCVQGVELDEQLLLGLLELNYSLPLGSFSVADQDIFFSYSVFGHNLDGRSLLAALEAVASISDDYDERIVAKYGGETALQRIQQAGNRKRKNRD